ncbi:MAG: alkaline phosphatase [Rhodothermales bacterium]
MPRLLLALCALLLFAAPTRAQDDDRPRNVIVMIADGFGPASATLAREFSGAPLAFDEILRGVVRTASSSSRVTDSAASATSYASGVKTYNGAIGVDSLQRPVGTVLEAAEARGMATGLVATSRITHATPAAFAAHVPYRGAEDEIAAQMVAQGVDVILGGGRRHFVPGDAAGVRTDGRDLLAEARAQGVAVVEDRAGFEGVTETPVLGLFAADHLDYEIDRTDQPSLAEMTRTALALLDGDEDGFFLLVEGSRIDHAAHANDPVGHVHDILAYDAAVRVALDFARADGRTLVLSTADHETGGMTLGRDGVYAWDPAVLARVRASADRMAALIGEGQLAADVLRDFAAVDSLSAEERTAIERSGPGPFTVARDRAIGEAVSRRAHVGWTTGGHTGIDVGLYAFGPGAAAFHGAMEIDAVGRALADVLGFDLAPITERLRTAGAAGSR